MHILIAPNAFKNSLDARQVALAIEDGLKQSKLDCTTQCFSIADGGDGTGSLIVESCKGKVVWKEVNDPLGRKIKASFGLIDNGKTAVIEMADASGLRLLKKEELNPLKTSSYGTGELIKFALDEGASRIFIAMGGSATVDGGCGILSALGIRFLNNAGDVLQAVPESLVNIAKIDASDLDKRLSDCEIVILCDVDNKLLGSQGAATVFGPQKGASVADVTFLDGFLANFAKISAAQTGKSMADIKHGGAAGGATAGLNTWLNAKLVNGIEYFLKLTNFAEALQHADLVISGEGSIDRQTLQGKGPYGVALQAKQAGLKVIGVAGVIPPEPDEELDRFFDQLICINEPGTDMATSMANTRENLVKTGNKIGDMLA
ncbi:glycerate kinase [Mucilaginibacter sp.]|uniref:glycerate kinase n=1 Tax=Mucilaginibacter sp. TaxID=1882438 RepID=UPI0025D9FAFB|nr:glycerate kinase [Mucilaginibacter sp.]